MGRRGGRNRRVWAGGQAHGQGPSSSYPAEKATCSQMTAGVVLRSSEICAVNVLFVAL